MLFAQMMDAQSAERALASPACNPNLHRRALNAVPLLPMQAALATLIGTAASYGYLRWLISDMAGLSRSTVQPFQDARRQQAQPLRSAVLALAAYR